MAPIYDYKGFEATGKPTKGVVEAETSKAARLKLKKSAIMVSEIREKTAAPSSSSLAVAIPFLGSRVSTSDMALATRQLASLIKANIPLVEALTAMVDQTQHAKLKVIFSLS